MEVVVLTEHRPRAKAEHHHWCNSEAGVVKLVVVDAGIMHAVSPEVEGWGTRVDPGEVVVVEGDRGGIVADVTANEGCLVVLLDRRL